ncbi:hypothetical protein HYH03_005428 [Edaphochlamys debaryana]|uniref:Sulfatase N-terminal domain-containing protein n=1 Tax=Edaphochlamys debaryana TaxID=47281 RepID=A0A835Y582_9CHLO|nr:hypothetical protein HYH03_005428 [Edaphochlamys debaryana]|eukprot:KAG2496607.1 hypothetical protein HYH03_005428 [Edaphochlamys debaryana]
MITDDQDDILNSTHPYYMPYLNTHLGQGGTRLSNFLVSTGLCCPARTSLFTGRLAHCHNITANHNNGRNGSLLGGFRKFFNSELDREWLPTRLRAANYDTYLVGKFLNGYSEDTGIIPRDIRRRGYVPRGVKYADLISAHVFSMTNHCWSVNGKPGVCPPPDGGKYQVDLIRDKAVDLISNNLTSDQPFFLYLATAAPHREEGRAGPLRPPDRYKTLYEGEGIVSPRGPNYGVPDYDNPASFWKAPDDVFDAEMDWSYLGRQQALRAVDDMVDGVVEALRAKGLLDTTYVLYTSDNGYHLGAHRMRHGKNTAVEEDTRIPLYVRGPGIPQGAVLPYQGNMIDIAPTLLTLAGLPIPDDMDGLPLPLTPVLEERHGALLRAANPQPRPLPDDSAAWLRRDTNILEAWNGEEGNDEFDLSMHFKALRVCTDSRLLPPSNTTGLGSQPGWAARFVLAPGTYCYKYTAWCGMGALRELYDLSTDPYEMENRYFDAPSRILDRLDAVLSTLAHCSGSSCRSPYALLHPQGGVHNFSGTLDPAYDEFYRNLPKLRIRTCMGIYQISNEPAWTLYQQAGAAFSPWPPGVFRPAAPSRPPPRPQRARAPARPPGTAAPPRPPEEPIWEEGED